MLGASLGAARRRAIGGIPDWQARGAPDARLAKVGYRFFDADLTKPDTQKTGSRRNF